ncbi:DUF1294 domain-containing protein [Salinimonas marina]|uniref:DUF1294 domain-containing protein n=1 Tax=Salinimonas marina TaxID=2785918 RepID=A0A7S9DZJ7_9ALTE|nr:DUF1294 domain-containing protein [Salinimonas marina]QPG06807.1 DUF1294 domain-containing protein [Salinimonas marina]
MANTKSTPARRRSLTGFTVVALLFVAALWVGAQWDPGLTLVALLYSVMSLITFIWYWRDKRASIGEKWRVPELTLHMMALLGGWPGACVAQQVFRHKTQKRTFRVVFVFTCGANIALISYLLFSTTLFAL